MDKDQFLAYLNTALVDLENLTCDDCAMYDEKEDCIADLLCFSMEDMISTLIAIVEKVREEKYSLHVTTVKNFIDELFDARYGSPYKAIMQEYFKEKHERQAN